MYFVNGKFEVYTTPDCIENVTNSIIDKFGECDFCISNHIDDFGEYSLIIFNYENEYEESDDFDFDRLFFIHHDFIDDYNWYGKQEEILFESYNENAEDEAVERYFSSRN